MSGALGAEIAGVDLARVDDEIFAEIHRAFLDHLVLFFRDQALALDALVAFGARFGPIGRYPFLQGLPDAPDVIEVRKEPEEAVNFGGVWHSDTAYMARPPLGSVLYAVELPPIGGDTLFANMYLAYENLSDAMKAILEGRRAVNSADKSDASTTRQDRIADGGKDHSGVQLTSVHPVIRTHPETDRRALYVNRGHTVCFEGMSAEESGPILESLFDHQIRPEFTCRFVWQPGSVAVWDNRCTQHYALNDYPGHRRVMHRVTMEGNVPS